MGAVGGLVGLAGGQSGTGFSTTPGATREQLDRSYEQNQGLIKALQAQNGIGNQSQVYNQLQGIVSGTGPNPAQNMLAQATGANVANQAALMAGQRGASGNVGLMARQNAMQGANLQQQAAGQGATMQANQSLNAMNQAGSMANNMAANQMQAIQNQQNVLQNANTANNQIQGQLANTTMQGQQRLLGGLGNAIGTAAGLAFADGGQVPGVAPQGPQSMFGKRLVSAFAEGGKVQAMVSPGEIYLPPAQAKAVAKGEANPFVVGEKIPGQAKAKGNSYANDTVKKTLTPGGVVVPRTDVKSPKASADFVRAVLAKKRKKK